jgi:hypothetical protein
MVQICGPALFVWEKLEFPLRSKNALSGELSGVLQRYALHGVEK